MSLLREWLSRFTNRVEAVKDRVVIVVTGHCRHRTHAEMIVARSYCPDCRRRYADWAEGIGLGGDVRRSNEWVDVDTQSRVSHSREWAGGAWKGWEKW